MGEAGIFDEDSHVELLDGMIYEMHPPRKYRFTVDEYDCLIEAGILTEDDHVELLEGEIIEMSPTGRHHVACVNRLTALFSRSIGRSAILSVQNPIRLANYAEPEPDVALLRPRDDFYEGELAGSADVLLAVEVAETSLKSDRTVKLPLYAKAGIPEVWLVDVSNGIVEVYTQPKNQKYHMSRRAGPGEAIAVREIPGLSIRVDEILG